MQFDEQRDHVAVEQILRVIFLDPERPSPVRLIIRKNNHLSLVTPKIRKGKQIFMLLVIGVKCQL